MSDQGSTGFDHLESALAKLEEQRVRATAIADEVRALTTQASNEDDTIVVTVGESGLSGLEIDARAMRLGSEALGEVILATVQAAMADHRAEIQRLTSELLADFPGPTTMAEAEEAMDQATRRWLD